MKMKCSRRPPRTPTGWRGSAPKPMPTGWPSNTGRTSTPRKPWSRNRVYQGYAGVSGGDAVGASDARDGFQRPHTLSSERNPVLKPWCGTGRPRAWSSRRGWRGRWTVPMPAAIPFSRPRCVWPRRLLVRGGAAARGGPEDLQRRTPPGRPPIPAVFQVPNSSRVPPS